MVYIYGYPTTLYNFTVAVYSTTALIFYNIIILFREILYATLNYVLKYGVQNSGVYL